MATNYFGTFYLTHMLLDRLARSPPSRMVITNSLSEMHGHLDFSDLKCELFCMMLSSNVAMLTGDNLFIAQSLAASIGVEHATEHCACAGRKAPVARR